MQVTSPVWFGQDVKWELKGKRKTYFGGGERSSLVSEALVVQACRPELDPGSHVKKKSWEGGK